MPSAKKRAAPPAAADPSDSDGGGSSAGSEAEQAVAEGGSESDGEEEEEEPPIKKEKKEKKEKKKKKAKRTKLEASASDFVEALSRRGVVYISRIPPKLTVSKLKTLLSGHGEITRIYLEEEDKTVRKRRKKGGGGGGKRYVEGWIEFGEKQHAKTAAEGLHMTNMERRGPHCEDLWMLRYLKGFGWGMLTEKVAYERRVREQKLKVEMVNAKREMKDFERRVEDGEKFEKMEARKGKKGQGLGIGKGERVFKRTFRQKTVLEEE